MTLERAWLKPSYDSWDQWGHWYRDGRGGGIEYVRIDIYDATNTRAEAAEAELERFTRVLREIADLPGRRWQRKAARDAMKQENKT
jgi:hypothetical protein